MPILSVNEFLGSKDYPPKRESGRVAAMGKNFDLFNGRFATLSTVKTHNRLQPNYFRWIVNFWEDFILSELPVITYAENAQVQAFIKALEPSLFEATREAIGDMISMGSGVFLNRRPLMVQVADPRFWFPVRDASDESVGATDIIAYQYTVNPDNNNDHLRVDVFEAGRVVTRLYTMKGSRIGSLVETREGAAGLPAVVQISLGKGFYGTSEFIDIKQYIEELHRRETSISLTLDKNANPHLAIPEDNLQEKGGKFTINKQGSVIPVPDGASNPTYVTWDAKFEAASAGIQRAKNTIFQMTQIHPRLVEAMEGGNQFATGAAIRRLAAPTVARVNLIRGKLDAAWREVIPGAAHLHAASGGEVLSIDPDLIQIEWPLVFGLDEPVAEPGEEVTE